MQAFKSFVNMLNLNTFGLSVDQIYSVKMQAEPSNNTVKLKCNLKQIINNISILVGFELQLYEQFDAIYSPACMAGCDLKFVVA